MAIRPNTYQDLIDHLVDYIGGATTDENIRFCRRAAQDAYNRFPSMHNWSYLYARGRVATVTPQTTGSVAYTNSTNTVTLTGATWPTWVLQGVLVLNNIPYPIATNPTNTTITLPSNNNPGADVAAGAVYTLYQDAYALPSDFIAADEIVNVNYGLRLTFEHPSQWLTFQRIYRGPSTPRLYCITGSPTGTPSYLGGMTVRFFPPPDQIYFMDAIYKRRMRPLNVVNYTTGTAATTSGSLTVSGSGTSWDANTMVGSIIRFSQSGNNVTPSGVSGQSPFYIERTITSVSSTTSLTVDVDPAYTGSTLYYSISDPLDIEEGSMLNFLLRMCEKQVRLGRRIKSNPEEIADYEAAKMEAMEADNRNMMRQATGAGGYPRRLRDFPSGPDAGTT